MKKKRNSSREQADKGRIGIQVQCWLPPNHHKYVSSILSKFSMSRSSVFYRGIQALSIMESDVQDSIATSNYIECVYATVTSRLQLESRANIKHTIYVYSIIRSITGRYHVIYKENNDRTDFAFKAKEFSRNKIDDEIMSLFPGSEDAGLF
jgi:hypothetical protein